MELTDAMTDIVDSNDDLVGGENAAILGDFSNYWIADSERVEVLRLAERYAESGEVGFQARQHTDGMPVISAAFYILKIKV